MKIYSILPVIGLFIIMQCGCSDTSIKDNNKISFRLLPCDYLTTSKDKKPLLLRLYAVDTYKDTADNELINKIDSFMCLAKDSINVNAYSSLIIRFLKETKLTRELKDNSITDSHNPVSSDHFSFVQYQWSNAEHFSKWINNSRYLSKDTILNCK